MVKEWFNIFDGPLALPNILLSITFGFLGFFVVLGLYQVPFRKLWRVYLSYADAFIDWKASIDRLAMRTIVPALTVATLVVMCILASMSLFPLVKGLENCHLTPEDGISYAVHRLGRVETLWKFLRECLVVGPMIPSLSVFSWDVMEHPLQPIFTCLKA